MLDRRVEVIDPREYLKIDVKYKTHVWHLNYSPEMDNMDLKAHLDECSILEYPSSPCSFRTFVGDSVFYHDADGEDVMKAVILMCMLLPDNELIRMLQVYCDEDQEFLEHLWERRKYIKNDRVGGSVI